MFARIIRNLTVLRLKIILSISDICLDQIVGKCHGYDSSTIHFVYLNAYNFAFQPETHYGFGHITLYINCKGNTIDFVKTHRSNFYVIKCESGNNTWYY
jgi:hypothetical protein